MEDQEVPDEWDRAEMNGEPARAAGSSALRARDLPETGGVKIQPDRLVEPVVGDEWIACDTTVADLGIEQDDGQPGEL